MSWKLLEMLGYLLGCVLVFVALVFGHDERPTAQCGACNETILLSDHSWNWPDLCPFCGEQITLSEVFK